MTDALKQAAQQMLEAFEYHTNQTRPILKTEQAIKALRAAIAAPQPAAPQADPCAPPEIQEAIERGEFEPGQWTVSAQRAIERNPSGALRIIAKLRDEVARLKVAPQPAAPALAQAVPLTNEQQRDLVKDCGLDWQRGYMPLFDNDPTNRYAVLIEGVERAHGIKQPGSEAC